MPRVWRALVTSIVFGLALASCDLGDLWRQVPPSPARDAGNATPADPAPAPRDRSPDDAGVPAAAGEARVAVYTGWRDPDGVDAFAQWLGRPVWAHDFLDHRQGWGAVADPRQQLDAWQQWVAGDDDRRLVLSVPLLIDAAAGDFAGGANGAYDRHFAELARNLVDRGLENTVIRLGWEFNGNTFPWAVPAGEIDAYRRFWTRAVTAMRDVEGAAFQFDWCPNITRDATGLPFAEMYPGDDVVDVVGLGVYDYYWNHPGASPEARWEWLRDVDNGLADHRDFAAGRGKPMSFPEYGLWEQGTRVGGGGDDPYFIEQLAAWIGEHDVAYHGYNNVDATADHRLTSYPRAEQAYRAAFGG